MIDATQWMVNLIGPDASSLVGALLVAVCLIEFIRVFKEWIRP